MELPPAPEQNSLAVEETDFENLIAQLNRRANENKANTLFPNEFLKKCDEFKKNSESEVERKYYKRCAQTFLAQIEHKPTSTKKP
jgi:hypothetical protein